MREDADFDARLQKFERHTEHVHVRVWKAELQRRADVFGLSIHVCHFPPGTSKWNKIGHRMFSFITMNWRGKPLDAPFVLSLDRVPHDRGR